MGARDRVLLGVVLGAHGLRGELRVKFFGDGPEGLTRMPVVALTRGPDDGDGERHEVEKVSGGRRGEARVALANVKDRDAAEALRGRYVTGDAEHLDPLPEGEYRWYELVGCRVEDPDGKAIGTIREIWETGAHDVLVVENEEGQQHLLPAASHFLQEVDTDGQRLVYRPIPGMLDAPTTGTAGTAGTAGTGEAS